MTSNVMDFLTHFLHLRAAPIDLAVAQEASVRATQRLKTPDALVVATGLVTQVGLLVANDDHWKTIGDTGVRVLYLEDHLPFVLKRPGSSAAAPAHLASSTVSA